MATYEVTGPDGHKYRVTGPDGASDAEVLAQVQAHAQTAAPVDPFAQTAQQDSNTDNLLAGIGGALTGVGLGARQIGAKFMDAVSPQAQSRSAALDPEIAQYKQSMAGLWSTPMGKVGTVAGAALPAIPAMMIPGVNSIAGSAALGAAQGALQPTSGDESRLLNTGLGAALGGAGQKVGNVIGGALSNRAVQQAADLGAQKVANTVRDSTLKAAQDAGYVLPPSQVNPSFLNRFAEGFAGKLTTAQSAAQKNQNVTNNLIKRTIGIPEDQPLTLDAIEAVRNQAAQEGYAPVRAFGQIAPDEGYAKDMLKVATTYDKSHGGLASLRNPQVEALLKDASTLGPDGALNSDAAVELIRSLRQQGFKNQNFAQDAAKSKLGEAQVDVANAMENLIDRRMTEAGQGDAVNAFRAARQKMAQTYDVENAFNSATGNVRASKLASLLNKEKPLSGGLRTVAEAGAAFPKATQEITSSMPGVSPLDYMAGLLGGAVNPAGLAAVVARPAARAGILSQAYQKAMVRPQSYDSGLIAKLLANNPDKTRELLGLLGGVEAPQMRPQ